MTTSFVPRCLLLLILTLALPALDSQARDPDHRDLAYADDHETAQRLDVYLVDSSEPLPAVVYLHGGGWRAGSKANLPQFLKQGLAKGWFHVVSVEYRFTDVAPHPAQVEDSVRAVQFVRHHAKEWGIDPDRLGVTGGSAGAHLSLWVALHDDLADPDSSDPIERHSSRVACVVGFAGPTDWKLLETIDHQHPAYRQLLGYEPGTPAADMAEKKKRHVSPASHASSDDPPVLIVHGDADVIVPFAHATVLRDRLEKAGASVELMAIEDGSHRVAGAGTAPIQERSLAFLRKHLEIPEAP